MDSEIITTLIGGAVTLANVVFTSLMAAGRRRNERTSQLEAGLQCLLRAEIIRSHEKYMDRGYCPVYAREALSREYEAYHALGGNGTITDLYQQITALPTEKEERHEN
ncbi:MAG: hypothetical protein J6A19_13525 [Oscillospiraceae bacterium]|nr:hypothetical protein [Oscillospiraceae bacterium]